MEITYLGHSSFKIEGKEVSIVCDPFDSENVGIPFPRTSANIITVSHDHLDHANTKGVKGEFICFDSPGEYEIKGSEITGIMSYHDKSQGAERGLNTIFVIDVDGVKIGHLGDLGSELSSEQLEKIDGIDVLMVPVGGVTTINAKEAAKVVAEIDPKIVIPMHYKAGKYNTLEPLENFLKETGKDAKVVDKLKVQKRDLPEELEVITFK